MIGLDDETSSSDTYLELKALNPAVMCWHHFLKYADWVEGKQAMA